MADDLDLLNDGPPDEWKHTRHCPSCGSTSLMVSSDDPLGGGWCTTECAGCGRHLRTDRLDAAPWEDPEWVKATQQ